MGSPGLAAESVAPKYSLPSVSALAITVSSPKGEPSIWEALAAISSQSISHVSSSRIQPSKTLTEIRAQIGKLKEWIGELFKARETAPEQPPQSPGLANLLMKYYTEYKPIHDELKKLKNGWTNKRDKYEEAHRAELTLWNAASRYLHANLPKGTKPPLPISEWEKEYATLSGQRTAEYTKLKETRAEVAELHNIRKCVDIALKADQPEQTRAKRHEQER